LVNGISRIGMANLKKNTYSVVGAVRTSVLPSGGIVIIVNVTINVTARH